MEKIKPINNKLDNFLGKEGVEQCKTQDECQGEGCIIKGDKSLVERINKKIITEDGRELLT